MFIHLPDDIPVCSKICIYGTGKRGILFKNYLEKHRKDIEIKCFIDSYKDDESVEGLRVININSFENIDFQHDFIVIASNFWQDIIKTLKNKKLSNYKILGTSIFNDFFSADVPVDTFEKSKIQQYETFREKIIDSLDSKEDKELYKEIYDIRAGKLTLDSLSRRFQNSGKIFYQYLDYINRSEIKTIIDCGVYDASGIDLFLRCLNNVEKIYGFEPLSDINCPCIEDVFPKDKLDKINIISKAVFTHKTNLNMLVNSYCSILTEECTENTRTVETISIDEFVQENKIQNADFIKMDIENAEIFALKGAKETIKKFRPQIATSIYHSNDQFFEVPLFLIENLENYTYKIGHYSLNLYETVLYCIPDEKLILSR